MALNGYKIQITPTQREVLRVKGKNTASRNIIIFCCNISIYSVITKITYETRSVGNFARALQYGSITNSGGKHTVKQNLCYIISANNFSDLNSLFL